MRYLTLDGLRGVAALAVVVFHAHTLLHAQYAPGGFLAVDMFFLLSGFVLAHAYDGRLDSMGALEFIRRRIIRFYPLYLLGLCLGAAWFAAELILRPPAFMTAVEGVRAFVLGLFFLPSPERDLYPFNVPAWSLSCELLVNIVFAVFHRRLTLPWLWAIVLASGLALALSWTGAVPMSGWMPVIRAVFGFFFGVVLYRSNFRWSASPWLLMALVAVALAVPVPEAWRGFYNLGCVFLLFPLVIAGGATQPRWARPFEWAGDASYTIYAIHYPLIWMVAALHAPAWITLLYIAVLLAITGPLQALYDRPVRRWLTAITGARPATVVVDPAG